MHSKSFFLLLFTLFIFGSACNNKDDDGGSNCIILDEYYSDKILVNGSSTDSLCQEVSEGFEIVIDWPFELGAGGEKWKFTFEGTEGFDILQGSAEGRIEPTITLIARADSPANPTIKVFAYNDCSETNRATTKLKVHQKLPHAINPRSSLPQKIASAVTFTYQGKGYILGGLRTPINGIANDHTWVFDSADNSFEELPISFPEAEAAAVVGDTAYILQDSGRVFQVYHIPSNTVVREINTGILLSGQMVSGHKFSCFAVGDKVYFGPSLFVIPQLLVYDVTTGEINASIFQHLNGKATIAAFLFENNIFFLTDQGTAEYINLTTGIKSSFSFPYTASGSDEPFVNFFSANGKAYFATTKGYYRFDTSFYWTPIEMFNGNDCNPTDWRGPNYNVSNFVIEDRVYFVGGQETEGGPPSDYFQGVRF